jgi:hypothetical protein
MGVASPFARERGSRDGSLETDSAALHEAMVRNLFARQSRIHLIKLPKTIALHAYATFIQN